MSNLELLDHALRLWTIDEEMHLHLHQTLLGHTHIIWSVAFGPLPTHKKMYNREVGRQLIVTGSSDQTVRVWDVKTGQSLYTLRG